MSGKCKKIDRNRDGCKRYRADDRKVKNQAKKIGRHAAKVMPSRLKENFFKNPENFPENYSHTQMRFLGLLNHPAYIRYPNLVNAAFNAAAGR